MEFFTLQDFMTHAKGMTYLTVVAFLFGFVAYWKFLAGGKDDDD